MKVSDMPYHVLQNRLNELFPGKAQRELEARRSELANATNEQLLVYAEYVRRNVRYGHSEFDCTTYEDAAKLLILPELISRLEGEEPR